MNELRMQRGAAVCMTLTTLIVAMLVPLNWQQIEAMVDVWWMPVSMALVVGAALCLLLEATVGSGRRIGALATILGLANTIGLVAYLIAWNGEPLSRDVGSPPVWSANTVVLPAVVLATVYRPRVPVLYLGGGLILLGTAQQYAKLGEFGYLGYTNVALTASLMAVFITAVYGVMQAVRAADRRREQVLATSARTAGRAARIAERERLEAVVRDHVIATLRTVAPGAPDARHQAMAAQTIAALDGVEPDCATEPRTGDVSAADTVRRLRDAVNGFGDDTAIDLEVTDPDICYPRALGDALVEASVEAIGNAVRHAGPTADRGIIGVFGEQLVRVRIVDDGVGFDPLRVPPDRAGIEVGIRGRMAAEAGGDAWVDSVSGEGTMVSLEWSRPS